MTLKKNIFLLTILSIFFILDGYSSQVSAYSKDLLKYFTFSQLNFETIKVIWILIFSIGVLTGGFAADKWNLRKWVIIVVLSMCISSLTLQFLHYVSLIIIQQCILIFSFGFLLISFKSIFTDLVIPRHRGKMLFILLNSTLIGSMVLFMLIDQLASKASKPDITYRIYQIPYIILPLLLFLVIRHIPDKTENNKRSLPLSYLFRRKQMPLIYIMIILSIVTAFTNAHIYFYESSKIITKQNDNILNILFGALGFIAVITGIIFIDKLGHKKLLTIGMITLTISVFINASASLLIRNQFIIEGFLFLYEFLFIFTILTTSYIIVLEYLPPGIRGRGLVLFALILWISNTINNLLTKTLLDTKYSVIISSVIILGVLIPGFFMIRKRLVETNGLPVEAIKDVTGIEKESIY